MRLGEILLQHGLITREQLRGALDAQRMYGGRLGTNLVHLGFANVDAVARALGEQLGMSAALRKHIAAIDRKLLRAFSARLVASYQAIPLGYTRTKPPRVVVACVDPARVPVEELAFAVGSRVDVWIAPEILVQECLERHYGVAPAQSRYVEVNFAANERDMPSSPALHGTDPTLPSDPAPAIPASPRVPSGTQAATRAKAPGPAPAADETPSSRGPAPRSAPRPPLPRLSPPPPPPRSAPTELLLLTPPPPPPLSSEAEPLRELPPPTPAPTALASAVGTELELPEEADWGVPYVPEPALPPLATAPPGMLRPIIDQAEAATLLEGATSTEQVGEVLADWLRSSFGCGLVLLVRGDALVGWKGFFLDAEEAIPTLSVPIEAPSLFSFAYGARGMYCGPPEPEGASVDAALWSALRCKPPSEVLVCPVIVGSRVVNILYAHTEDGGPFADDAVCDAQLIAADAAAAYLRLIRQGREREHRDF